MPVFVMEAHGKALAILFMEFERSTKRRPRVLNRKGLWKEYWQDKKDWPKRCQTVQPGLCKMILNLIKHPRLLINYHVKSKRYLLGVKIDIVAFVLQTLNLIVQRISILSPPQADAV